MVKAECSEHDEIWAAVELVWWYDGYIVPSKLTGTSARMRMSSAYLTTTWRLRPQSHASMKVCSAELPAQPRASMKVGSVEPREKELGRRPLVR